MSDLKTFKMVQRTVTLGLQMYVVEIPEHVVDAINRRVNLGDYGVELFPDQNLLLRDTLWFLLCELKDKTNLPREDACIYDFVKELKAFLYPNDEDDES